ncbi:flavodoxin family protein [Geomesophilobacter sediminis]|uniref:Flavodoxin family protein n=1 Tax=Geomesophilobacter sediminis TaxID=2798584 RepID=A0A8J7IM61_9BACT|nr:flavodoxin family protein [Geomesophilobacter sediminis]MBJ6723723.1 flavodoxin family protein [Geomesophilobacter sediminis]
MKVIAVNGSPRKQWNTALLLEKALEGAAARGAETEIIHLYDLNFKGCMSCFACKTRGGPSYGRCGYDDDLTPILKKIEDADALIIGSPIYFGNVTGELHSFLERLLFPYGTYTEPPQSLFPRKINTAIIYTMNMRKEQARELGYFQQLSGHERTLEEWFGASESLYSFDTYQFDDYNRVVADRFDPGKKAKRREHIFPLDLQNAFDLGSRLIAEPCSP